MLPPYPMLATKNWRRRAPQLASAVALAVLVGCKPAGPSALLDGERLLNQGQYPQAITRLEVATRLLPNNAQAWNHLGLAYHRAGQLDAAAKAYQQARRCDLNLAAVRYNLGCLLLEQNDPQQAIAELTTYTMLEHDSVDGWLKLATAQLRARQFEQAERSFEGVLHLQPDSAEAFNGIGVIQVQRKHSKDALNSFNAALQRQPNYPPALLNLAVLFHHSLNNHPLALEKYREYLAAQPSAREAATIQEIVQHLEAELAPKREPTNVVVSVVPQPAVTNLPSTPQSPVTKVASANTSSRPPGGGATANPSNSRPPKNVSSNTSMTPESSSLPAKTAHETVRKVEAPVRSEQPVVLPPAVNVAKTASNSPERVIALPEKVSPAPEPGIKAVVEKAPDKVSEPPAKTDIVRINDEPPVKAADDFNTKNKEASTLVVAPSSITATNDVTSSAATPSQIDQATALLAMKLEEAPRETNANEKKRVIDRINPASWFRGKKRTGGERSASELSEGARLPSNEEVSTKVVAATERPYVPPPVTLRRYAYKTPSKPAAGDRAKAEPVFAEAIQAQRDGHLSEAIDGYKKALKADPSFFEAHYNLGLAAYDMRDLQRSLTAYETALVINPASVNARYNFALALEKGNYFQDASDQLEKLVAQKPEETRAHFTLANLYAEKLGMPTLAREHYRKVLELEPQHSQAAAIRYWLAANP